ncbi:MAG: hypothetical protein WKG01_31420 [Kofleriaceae bacterium]
MELVESDQIQLDATGTDLRLPDANYGLIASAALDIDDDARVALEALAERHGAVLFRARGHADDDWQTHALFRTAAAWSVLEINGNTLGAGGNFLALVPDASDEAHSRTARAGMLIGHGEREMRIWESDGWQLRPHPLLAHEPVRDWPWSWPSGYGPITIDLNVARAAELDQFLEACAPIPYQQIAPRHYRTAHRALFADLRVLDGGYELARGYQAIPPDLVAFDAGFLVALARGALGPITWDVIDEDYHHHFATGHDGDSLLAYLDPATDAEAQKAQWQRQFVSRVCDARSALTPGQLVEALSVFLGARVPVPDHLFDPWLASLPIESLPRRIEIVMGEPLYDRLGVAWLFTRLGRAQPRLSWSTRAGEPG